MVPCFQFLSTQTLKKGDEGKLLLQYKCCTINNKVNMLLTCQGIRQVVKANGFESNIKAVAVFYGKSQGFSVLKLYICTRFNRRRKLYLVVGESRNLLCLFFAFPCQNWNFPWDFAKTTYQLLFFSSVKPPEICQTHKDTKNLFLEISYNTEFLWLINHTIFCYSWLQLFY